MIRLVAAWRRPARIMERSSSGLLLTSSLLSAVKLVIMPLMVYGLSVSLGLDPLYTIAAVVCAAVPTAKTAYILAGKYHYEEVMVASTVSMTTLASVISLVVWLYWLSGLATRIPAG